MIARGNTARATRAQVERIAPNRTIARWYRRAALTATLTAGLCTLVPAAGCGAARRNVEPLEMSVTTYHEGLRWERFQQAAGRIPVAERDDFLDHRDVLSDDLRIHHYEVIRVRYGPENQRARVHVKFTWFLDSHGVVHESHVVQRWQRGEAFWLLIGETMLRGEPMPGVPSGEGDEDGEDDEDGADDDDDEYGDDEYGADDEDSANGDDSANSAASAPNQTLQDIDNNRPVGPDRSR